MTADGNGIRLNKRVMELVPCSRAEAERYIAGGWVSVDGKVVEEPAARVTPLQDVRLLPGAVAAEVPPVTIVVHKRAGEEADIGLIAAERQYGHAHFLRQHLANLKLVAPLEKSAAGMVVFTQDFRVERKLGEGVEHEVLVDVGGKLEEGGLARLNRDMKASWQSEHRLRIATKHYQPGHIERVCGEAGLAVIAIRRIRLGRVPLAQLPAGQWRYLGDFERF